MLLIALNSAKVQHLQSAKAAPGALSSDLSHSCGVLAHELMAKEILKKEPNNIFGKQNRLAAESTGMLRYSVNVQMQSPSSSMFSSFTCPDLANISSNSPETPKQPIGRKTIWPAAA